MKYLIIMFALLAGAAPAQTNNVSTTNLMVWKTNFLWMPVAQPEITVLTITNRPWLRFDGSAVVRVTDAEWGILTNAYPSNISMETIRFKVASTNRNK